MKGKGVDWWIKEGETLKECYACTELREREVWRGEGDNDAYFTPARQPQ